VLRKSRARCFETIRTRKHQGVCGRAGQTGQTRPVQSVRTTDGRSGLRRGLLSSASALTHRPHRARRIACDGGQILQSIAPDSCSIGPACLPPALMTQRGRSAAGREADAGGKHGESRHLERLQPQKRPVTSRTHAPQPFAEGAALKPRDSWATRRLPPHVTVFAEPLNCETVLRGGQPHRRR
jgi:hypothetical protein